MAEMETQVLESPKKKLGALLERASQLRLEEIPVKGYEKVVKVTDPKSGLLSIIAIHNSLLGPALGGTRIRSYKSFQEALEDALRLARGMTYKSALAELGLGGGKSVIIADPNRDKTPELLRAFGSAVEELKGAYICAEDMGCSPEDLIEVRRTTKYVVGLPHEKSSGDPGPFTAWGIFRGIQAVLQKLFGSDSLDGKVIAIQGLGNVGSKLAGYLFWAGAELIVSDINPERAAQIARQFGARVVAPDQILKVDCDVFAPCAAGEVVNDQTIPHFRCRAIAGAANNQLAKEIHAEQLRAKKILYAPDFVINAGGLYNVAAELEDDGYTPTFPRNKINRIYDRLLAIFEIAERNRESTHMAAVSLADYRIRYSLGKRTFPPVFHHTAS